MKNLKEYYNNHKLAFTVGIGTFLLFLSTLYVPLTFLAAIFFSLLIFTLNTEETLCLMLYSLFFSKFITVFICISVFGFINIIIDYILCAKHNRKMVYKFPLILTTVISIMFSVIVYDVDTFSIAQGFLIIALLFFCYFMFCRRKEIKLSRLFNFMFMGLVASLVFSGLMMLMPFAKIFVFNDFDFVVESVSKTMVLFDGTYYRWSYLSFHVNHLCIFCLFLIAYAVHSLVSGGDRKKWELVYYYAIILITASVGFLTLSKAFIVAFGFILFYGLCCFIHQYKLKSIKIIIPALCLVIVMCAIFSFKIIDIFERFFVYGGQSVISMITTGRSGIWSDYVNAICSSPLKMLFGFGLFSSEVVAIGPHNFYLFIFYRVGLIGLILLTILGYSYYISCEDKLKIRLKKCLPILLFLALGMEEAIVDERFYFFVFAVMLMFDGEQKLELSKPNLKSFKQKKRIIDKC